MTPAAVAAQVALWAYMTGTGWMDRVGETVIAYCGNVSRTEITIAVRDAAAFEDVS